LYGRAGRLNTKNAGFRPGQWWREFGAARQRTMAYYQRTGRGLKHASMSDKADALAAVARVQARNRERTQLAQEEKLAEAARARKKERSRRREAGELVSDEDDELPPNMSDLRPVGVDQGKTWGAAAQLMDDSSAFVDGRYPRHPGRDICARFNETGRCKFCDEGGECNFDHPPPDNAEVAERKRLKNKGLKIIQATWGFYNRRGQPVPGKSIDVTGALRAMVLEQGGRSLEIPRDGKVALPGFGDPCPDLEKQLRITAVRCGGGTCTTKHRWKEHSKVMLMTRQLAACNCVKRTCCLGCPLLWVLTGVFFVMRWMMLNLHTACVDANFTECAVDNGTRPVPVANPCIIPFEFESENILEIDIALERGDVNVTVTDTRDNLILIDIMHIALSKAAIPGLQSSAVSEDGVIIIRSAWNDTFTEDMEGAPLNTLNCFRSIVTVQVPPDMAYLRPSLTVNVTAKPMDCTFWNPSGCESWELYKFFMNLPDPYLLPYGLVQVFSSAYGGRLPDGGSVGFQWSEVKILTTSGAVELYDVELYDGPDATITVDVFDNDIVIYDAYAHTLKLNAAGTGSVNISGVELLDTEGALAKLGVLEVAATEPHSALKIEQVRYGNIQVVVATQGDVNIRLSPEFFAGRYELQGGFTVAVEPTVSHLVSGVGAGVIGNRSTKRQEGWRTRLGPQEIFASTASGAIMLAVDRAADPGPLRPRPLDGALYPCMVDPNAPGCVAVSEDCTSC
jgi:hypothetical protein